MSRSRRHLDGAVLDLTRRRGVVTRLELAEDLEVTPATITNVVKRLLADDLLIETGYSASTGGKRRTLLRLNPASRYAVGLSLDPTRLMLALTDFAGTLVGRAVTPMPAAGDLEDVIDERLSLTLRAVGVAPEAVAGFGIVSTPNRPDPWLPSDPATADLASQAAQRLRTAAGRPVIVGDEASCAAMGELWARSAGTERRFATVYMSDQLSAGIALHGRVNDAVPRGNFGHMSIDRNGPPCPCGSRGCIDVLASPAAVVAQVLTNPAHAVRLGLSGTPAGLVADFSRIARGAMQGDRTCAAAITDAASALAVGIANLVTVLGLEQVILSGPGFVEAGGLYERVIGERLNQLRRVGSPAAAVTLSALDLGLEAATIGAAALVLQASVAD
ncbi:ROK family transcriptional regulator [Microlunatus parietis]|uniref:Putative NBD/HSP70 family sugar kinase n=1 Tax=Microlunatus parietis TaxID=682979 RepID=A0A7Y9LCD1_9ACTN|nr:ROK family transcriptional regulator [Microlunatus parietis]NYE72722.1 putative NBD/HSP70 family sugar kinase [Microlunatus parietis]